MNRSVSPEFPLPPPLGRPWIIASRQSPLALAQAHWVQATLQAYYPTDTFVIKTFVTTGDMFLDKPLQAIGGKGLFTKELEQALWEGHADLAVHSAKDVPYRLPPGLIIGAICVREDPRDAWVFPRRIDPGAHPDPVSDPEQVDWKQVLPPGARVGTVSLRRRMQIHNARPDLVVLPLRGNLNRRLARLDAEEFDAIVLAGAGLRRMQWFDRISAWCTVEAVIPAAGQGALAIECRADNHAILSRLQPIHHPETAEAVWAERALCAHLGGSCLLPMGAYGYRAEQHFTLRAILGNLDGTEQLQDTLHVPHPEITSQSEAEAWGIALAERLLSRGAGRIIRACQSGF